jgi:hypothetical protein
MSLALKANPNWFGAAQSLANGCLSLTSREDRVRLMARLCKDLGDELYPAFLQILFNIAKHGDTQAQHLITDTLVHALTTGQLPSGKLSAWGSNSLNPERSFGQTRSLGPIEYLCVWYAQPSGRSPLNINAFQQAAHRILELISTNEQAKSLYCNKLLADVEDPLGGSLSSQTRNAITELVNTWQTNATIDVVINHYINTLQGDSLSRLANFQPTLRG